jgi:Flp pilus assembly protein TadG
MIHGITKSLSRLKRDEAGTVLIYIALIFTIMAGLTGLAVDTGAAYDSRQKMQTAADAAAFSGELALIFNETAGCGANPQPSSCNIAIEGKAVAAASGFVDGQTNVTVTINHPPVVSATYIGNANAVEAVIQKTLNTTFANLFGIGTWNITVHAVASKTPNDYCMLALDTSGKAIQANGNVTIGTPNCGIADNSASNPATDFKGGSGTVNGPFSVVGTENTNGNNYTFNYANNQNAAATLDPYTSGTTAANGFSNENAWVMAQRGTNLPWTFTTHTINANSAPSSATCTGKNPSPSVPPNNGPYNNGGSFCTVSAGTFAGNKTFNMITVNSGATLGGAATYNINTVNGGTFNGTGTYNIGTVNGGTLSSGTYDIYQVSSGITISGSGTYWIKNLPSTGGATLSSANGGTFYIDSLPNDVTLQGNGTFYINTVQSGVTISGGGIYYINNLSSGVTLSGTGTYYINNWPSMTLSGASGATYYLQSVSAGQTIDGVNGGASASINSVSGGTLQNGIFKINTINLSSTLTTANATLVVFTQVAAGNNTFNISAPTANMVNADNKGLALVSPNAISMTFGGNGNLKGVIYAPNTTGSGSSVSMNGTVTASCAQIIAGSILLGGNVQLANDNSCGLQNITNNAQAQLVE